MNEFICDMKGCNEFVFCSLCSKHLKEEKREAIAELKEKLEKELHERMGFPLSVRYLVIKKEDWDDFWKEDGRKQEASS